MKQIHFFIYLHILFWVGVVVLSVFNYSIAVFGIPIPIVLFFWTFSLPVLLKMTWSVPGESQSKLIKNYSFAFRWVGCSMLVFSILVTFVVLYIELHAPTKAQ
jgi:hypothetical protein